MTLAEAAQQAQELAERGDEQALADLRRQWDEDVEAAAQSQDVRERAVAFRAIGQYRFREKIDLLRRGLDDESPGCSGSALVSLELLSRENPGAINAARPLLHRLVSADGNEAVRRLAVMCLKNGPTNRDTITLLRGLASDDEQEKALRDAAGKVAEVLRKKGGAAR